MPGRSLILSLLNHDSTNAVQQWIEALPLEKVKQHNLSFINIVFPGGLFFLIPPRKALKTLQKRIDREVKSYLEHAGAKERRIFQELDIRWVADFDQSIFEEFNLSPQKSHFLFFNSQGDLLGQYTGFSEIQKIHFLWRLNKE